VQANHKDQPQNLGSVRWAKRGEEKFRHSHAADKKHRNGNKRVGSSEGSAGKSCVKNANPGMAKRLQGGKQQATRKTARDSAKAIAGILDQRGALGQERREKTT